MNFNNNIYIQELNNDMMHIQDGRWNDILYVQEWEDMTWLPYPPFIFDNSQFNTPTDYTLMWLFLLHQNVSRLKKDFDKFDKSDVYSAFSGEVQTVIIMARKSGKWKEGEKKRKDSTMNKSKS